MLKLRRPGQEPIDTEIVTVLHNWGWELQFYHLDATILMEVPVMIELWDRLTEDLERLRAKIPRK